MQGDGQDAAATSAASILPAASITAHHSEGLRMVGVMRRSQFQPNMPLLDAVTVASTEM